MQSKSDGDKLLEIDIFFFGWLISGKCSRWPRIRFEIDQINKRYVSRITGNNQEKF